MLKKPILWVAVAVAMLLGVACSSTATAPAAQAMPVDEAAPAQEEMAEALPEATEESPEVVEETVKEEGEEPEQPAADVSDAEVMHRANSAPLDSFVADSPEWVAATGRPQLIEFFAYW